MLSRGLIVLNYYLCSTSYCRWSDRFASLKPKFHQYCDTLCDFKKNRFDSPLDAALAKEVEHRFSDSYVQFGYQKSFK